MPERLPITPETKVAALLDQYPELEEVLIGIAPPFKKLRNPILRRSVARVASLRQAAAVGRLPVLTVVNELRAVVGQEPIAGDEESDAASYFSTQPDWFDSDRVVASINEQEVDPDVMPLRPLLLRTVQMADGEIVELVTEHLPAPAIDIMKEKGFATWSVEREGSIMTYFSKLAP